MKKLKSWMLPLFVASWLVSILTGCAGNRETTLYGTWKVSPESLSLQSSSVPVSPNTPPVDAKKMFAGFSLDFRNDQTFTLNMWSPISGTWSLDAKSGLVTLNINGVANRAALPNRSLAFQLDDANTHLTMYASPIQTTKLTGLSFIKS